jgi:hypothetical protein
MDTKEEIVKIKLDNKKLAERLSELQSITTQVREKMIVICVQRLQSLLRSPFKIIHRLETAR